MRGGQGYPAMITVPAESYITFVLVARRRLGYFPPDWVSGAQLASLCLAILMEKPSWQGNRALCTAGHPHNAPAPRALQCSCFMLNMQRF